MARLSHVEILGGGPAGLYTAILLRRLMPSVRVHVSEQNPAGATFGFGVVFSDSALDFLKAADSAIHALVTPHVERWRNMTLNLPHGPVVLDGVGFASIGRLQLIELLRHEADRLGVEMTFGRPVSSLADLQDADLVIGADGLNSLVRQSNDAAFRPSLDYFTNRFAWFGAERSFDTLTQTFLKTELGALNAHHYRFTPKRSTFIVECDETTFGAYGFAALSEQESAKICEKIFANVLNGACLITNKSNWRQFPRLWCEQWVAGRHVIIGDAAHTAHFSIGSGTRLAFDDAIALVTALSLVDDVDEALGSFQRTRPPIAKKIVDAANTSANWYENFASKLSLSPMDFAFDYITRSGRVDRKRLRKIAPGFAKAYEAEKLKQAQAIVDPVAADVPGALEINFRKEDHPNCSTVLWDNLDRAPDKLALTGPGGDITYAELVAAASRWGNAFKAWGLQRGERVAFILDDTPAFAAAFFGAARAGFVPVLLNIQTKPDVLQFFLQDTSARIAVTEAEFAGAMEPDAFAGTELEQVVIVNGEPREGQLGAATFLDGHSRELACADTGPDDMALWMYSSGSTGRPKGIVHLHHDVAYIQQAFGRNVLKLRADDRCFSVPKMYFAYGFGNALIFPFSVGATTVLLAGQPRPSAVLDVVEKYRPTVLFGLPTLYTALAHSEGIENRDLSSLRQSMSAAEVLSREVYTRWKDLTGHGPIEGLGSTEMLHIYLSNSIDDHRFGAAGGRVPGYEVRLELPDGNPAKAGEEGVMLVRGHSSAPCYWNRPDKTRETMRGDWLYTGDRFIERDGYYYFQGRTDDLIKVSGQWVWPLEVERCLNDHPDVMECAVLPHKLADERMTLRAIVRLKDGTSGSDAQTEVLRNYVKAKLEPYKYPRIVEYVANIPKTGTGKIDRQALLK